MKSRQSSALFACFLVISLPLVLSSRALGDALPAGWTSVDVGDVGIAGSASGDVNSFFVNGAGSDIWGTADSFHFVYQPFDDGQIAENPPRQDATNPFAKAGLMIRMSLDPGSPHVILDVKPDGTYEFMTRQTQNGPTTFITGGPFSGLLQLIRRNGVVTAQACDGTRCRALGTTNFPTGMALAGVAVTSHDPSTLNHTETVNAPQVFPGSIWWLSTDVGNVGLRGDGFVENDTYTIRGAGADMWGASDSYHSFRHAFSGDGTITARVTSEQAADTFAKAGVEMFSNGKVLIDVRPNGLIEFMARQPGGEMQFITGYSAVFPVSLRLERRGDQFAGWVSQDDGFSWRLLAITTVNNMSSDLSAGLAVTSHDPSALNTSTFDHVLVASQFPSNVDIGDVGIAGALDFNQTELQGGGGDIWGTADAFEYYYQEFKDDSQMVVRFTSLGNTHQFAKAGLMIRDSLDPSSANLLIDVTPSGYVELLQRTALGAQTQWIGGLSNSTLPIWLKLSRFGGEITASASYDGSTWIVVGSTRAVHVFSKALVGIAVTSHHRGVLTTATFDNVSR